MPNPVSNIPVILFPLKLETRFVGDELWIRAFPDTAFLQSHNPHLSKEEKADAEAFKKLNSKEEQKQTWEELVSKYGVYRAAWLVQISGDELERQVNADLKDEEPSFYFKWLPDRLVFYLYKEGDPKPAYKADGSVIDREGLTVLGEGDEWPPLFPQNLHLFATLILYATLCSMDIVLHVPLPRQSIVLFFQEVPLL